MTTTTKTPKPTTNGAEGPSSAARVRLIGLTVNLDVVTDDGETLTPVRVQPIAVTAAQWPSFDLRAVLADIERQTVTDG